MEAGGTTTSIITVVQGGTKVTLRGGLRGSVSGFMDANPAPAPPPGGWV